MADHSSAVVTTEIHHPRATIQFQHAGSNTNATADSQLPLGPLPSSSDFHFATENNKALKIAEEHGIFKTPPSEALKLLSANVELLVRLTGDVPPTPPPKSPTVPHMSGMQAEKENIARTHSDKNLAKMRKQAELESKNKRSPNSPDSKDQAQNTSTQTQPDGHETNSQGVDGVKLKQSSAKPSPYIIIGADSQPINLQHGAITRKFYSKNEPPITINQYLLRLHQFCPMSTAVYLATSLYIHRLAVEERAIPVTRRNAHRLVLAGLRVAMKALEDLSYPHSKMAKVGGVSEAELARLEISFCFLAGFELVVGVEGLQKHYESLKAGTAGRALDDFDVPTLKLARKPRGQPQPTG